MFNCWLSLPALCRSCILDGQQAQDFCLIDVWWYWDYDTSNMCKLGVRSFLSIRNWFICAPYWKTVVKVPLTSTGENEPILRASQSQMLMSFPLPLAIHICQICWLISLRVMHKLSRAKSATKPVELRKRWGQNRLENSVWCSFVSPSLKSPIHTASKEVNNYIYKRYIQGSISALCTAVKTASLNAALQPNDVFLSFLHNKNIFQWIMLSLAGGWAH